MAKWDYKKLEREIAKAEKEDSIPLVPITTPKISYEDSKRRYEKG